MPDAQGVVGVAPGEAREDMTIPVFGTVILGVPHRKIVEEDFDQ